MPGPQQKTTNLVGYTPEFKVAPNSNPHLFDTPRLVLEGWPSLDEMFFPSYEGRSHRVTQPPGYYYEGYATQLQQNFVPYVGMPTTPLQQSHDVTMLGLLAQQFPNFY